MASYDTAPPTAVITNQDIATPFILNSLTMNSTNGAALDGTSGRGFVVAGGALNFQGSGATIVTQQSGTTPSQLRIDSATTFSVDTILDIQGNVTAANAGAELRLTNYSAAAGTRVTVTTTTGVASGAAVIFGQAYNTTFQGTLALGNAVSVNALLAANNAVGRSAILDTTGGNNTASIRVGIGSAFATADTGVNAQIGRLVGTNTTVANGSFQLGAGTTAATALVGFDNVSSTFNGQIGLNGSSAARNTHFGKVGTGTLTLNSADATNQSISGLGFGTFAVQDGSVILGGTNGRFSSSTLALQIYAGATLQANNATSSSSDRLPGNGTTTGDRAIVLSGGTLNLTGNSSTTAAFSEITSGIRLTSGQSTLLIDGVGAGRATRLSFTATTTGATGAGGLEQRNNSTATVFFRSTNLGQFGSTSANTTGGFAFTTAPTLVGGNAASATSISILPYGFGTGATSASTVTTPESFVTYSTANVSIRSLTDAEYAPAFGTNTDNVSLATPAVLAGTTTANSLRLTAGGSLDLGSNGLTLTSGALLNNGGGNVVGTGTLTTPATFYVTASTPFTISAPVSAANFSKNGPGNLTIDGPVTLTTPNAVGIVAVNAGTLTLGGNGSIGNAGTFQVSKGATLAGPGLSVATGQVLQGAGTVSGQVVVGGPGNTGTIRPSSLGGPSASLASPGVLTVGSAVFGGGGTYEWYVNSVLGGQYTQSLIISPGALNITATAGSKFNIQVTPLQLSNATGGPVYDVEAGAGYQWTIATFTGGITGNTGAENFNVQFNPADFAGGNLSASVVGNNVVLVLAPVPEPVTTLGAAAAGLGLAGCLRRRRKIWKRVKDIFNLD